MPQGSWDPRQFDLSGRVAIVTGGTGAPGGAMVRGLARSGASVAVLARRRELVEKMVADVRAEGGVALGIAADVLDGARLEEARAEVADVLGPPHVLVNAAGGNRPEATVAGDDSVFDLPPGALRGVVELNLMGTFLPVQVFGPAMAEAGRGSIVNVSSAAASRPLSGVAGYGAAKAAVENLTRWLADHLSRRFGPALRVNAVAPGFFLADQNRELLQRPDGTLTERGHSVVSRTPMGRLGDPGDLVGPVVWLASDASRFVTGAVVPVDGGFSAVSGV